MPPRKLYPQAPILCREYQQALAGSRCSLTEIAEDAGVVYNTAAKYQRELPASVAQFERLLHILGYDLIIVQRRPT